MHTNVAIIGSGPAGLTAAIYAGRALLKPLVITGREFGGQLMWTTDVENYPGFHEGVLGPDLVGAMRSQAARFETTFSEENAVSIDTATRPFVIQTESQTHTADTVILAMGASPLHLSLKNEERLRGKGVSYCATCDGFFFRQKTIAVIGGGDSAMEEALFLTRFASKIYVVHRRDSLRASKIMQEKAKANPKIEFIWDSVVTDVLGNERVSGLTLQNVKTRAESELSVEGVFVAIGHSPNSQILNGQVATDSKGYVLIEKDYQSSVPGLFVAGDIHDHRYRQAITAAAAGCAAALEVERYLSQKG